MQWWRDARFGMFIHWGLYAIPAGTWNGKTVRRHRRVDHGQRPTSRSPSTRQLAKQFNPVKYDPAEWVRIAKDAGMKYIVITSKHHDGFCLFDSAATQLRRGRRHALRQGPAQAAGRRVPQAGPEVLHLLLDHGLAPSGPVPRQRPDHYNPTKIHPERKREYMDYMKAQLKELLDSCDPAVLWFDGEWPDWWTEEDARDVYTFLRELKPRHHHQQPRRQGPPGHGGHEQGRPRVRRATSARPSSRFPPPACPASIGNRA